MKLLGIAEKVRIKSLPNVPTIHEAVPGVEAGVWMGFFAPAGTPKPIVDRLNEALRRALDTPEVQQKLDRIGVIPLPGTSEAFATRVRDDLLFWREAIDIAGIAPQ